MRSSHPKRRFQEPCCQLIHIWPQRDDFCDMALWTCPWVPQSVIITVLALEFGGILVTFRTHLRCFRWLDVNLSNSYLTFLGKAYRWYTSTEINRLGRHRREALLILICTHICYEPNNTTGKAAIERSKRFTRPPGHLATRPPGHVATWPPSHLAIYRHGQRQQSLHVSATSSALWRFYALRVLIYIYIYICISV